VLILGTIYSKDSLRRVLISRTLHSEDVIPKVEDRLKIGVTEVGTIGGYYPDGC
jgi:hypothetical protein